MYIYRVKPLLCLRGAPVRGVRSAALQPGVGGQWASSCDTGSWGSSQGLA